MNTRFWISRWVVTSCSLMVLSPLPSASTAATRTGSPASASTRPVASPATDDGAWQRIPQLGRTQHSAIYDPIRHRMLVYGGMEEAAIKDDVYELSLSGGPTWTHVTTAGPTPPGRYEHSAIYDPVRDRMVIYGGSGGSDLNDVWALSLSGGVPTWSQIPNSGATPGGRRQHAAVYDPVRDRMLVFGGTFSDVYALTLADPPTWAMVANASMFHPWDMAAIYDPVRDRLLVLGSEDVGVPPYNVKVKALSLTGTPTWTTLATSGTNPGPRHKHTAIYDPARDAITLYGGSSDQHVWRLDLATMVWTQLSYGPPDPVALSNHTAILDSGSDRMIVHGGSLNSGNSPQTLFFHLDAPPVMETMGVVPFVAMGRYGHTAIYDPADQRMVVFGGHVGSTVPYSGFSNSSWSLSLGLNPTWMPLTTTGTPPTADHPYVAIDDEPRHRMIVLDGTVPQVWQLPLESYEWSSLATSSPPSPGTPWGAMYDPSRQSMWVCEVPSGDVQVQVWELTLSGTPAWSFLITSGSPGVRDGAAALYDPVRDRIIVFGGSDLADVWQLPLSGDHSWSQIVPSGTPPPGRRNASVIYDVRRDRMVMFGGWTPSINFYTSWNDVWALSLSGTPEWRQLAPTGLLPIARYEHTSIYDPVGDRMVVHGGQEACCLDRVILNDVPWLQWDQSTLGVGPPSRRPVSRLTLRLTASIPRADARRSSSASPSVVRRRCTCST
jgi:hypothetical protein